MGACKAPISNLLLPSPPPSPPTPNQNATTRRLLLFSLPLLTTATTTNNLPLSTTGAKIASANSRIQLNSCWALAESYDPVSQAEKEASTAISRRVSEAVELLEKGRELQARGDFNEALLYFTLVCYPFPLFLAFTFDRSLYFDFTYTGLLKCDSQRIRESRKLFSCVYFVGPHVGNGDNWTWDLSPSL